MLPKTEAQEAATRSQQAQINEFRGGGTGLGGPYGKEPQAAKRLTKCMQKIANCLKNSTSVIKAYIKKYRVPLGPY